MDPEKLKETVRTLEVGLKEAETEASKQRTRADSAEAAAGEAKGVIKTLEQERDALRTQIAAGAQAVETAVVVRERSRADALEAKVARFDETIEDLVASKTELRVRAAAVLDPGTNMRGLTDRQVMAAVVKRLDSSADVSDAVEMSYLKGRFDSLMKLNLQRARQDANVAEILGTDNEKTRTDTREQKRQEYRDQWKKPLSVLLHKKGA